MAKTKTTSPEEVQNAPQQQVQPQVQPQIQVQPQAQPQPQIIIQQAAPAPSNGLGTTGFVFAIIGLFLDWIPGLGWIIWFLGVLFSFIGLFKKPRGLAITGFILSFIDLLIILFLASAIAAVFSA